MPEQRLQPLRAEAALDCPRSEEMPQSMQAVFRFAVVADHAGLRLEHIEATVRDVGVALDLSTAVREYEIERPLRAGQPPFSQRVNDHRRHGNFPVPGG